MRFVMLEGHRFPVEQIARYYDSEQRGALVVFFVNGTHQEFPKSTARDLDKQLRIFGDDPQIAIDEKAKVVNENIKVFEESINKEYYRLIADDIVKNGMSPPPDPPWITYDVEEPPWYSWTRIKSALLGR